MSFFSKKINLTLLLILLLATSALSYKRIYLYYFIKSNYSKNKTQWAYAIPKSISLRNADLKTGISVFFKDMIFKIPFGELSEKQKTENSLILLFHIDKKDKGLYIFFNNPFIKGVENSIKLPKSGKDQQINFDLYKKCIFSSPDRASIFSTNEELSSVLKRLWIKRFLIRKGMPMFFLDLPKIQGFQHGDPQKHSYVEADIFFRNNFIKIKFSNFTQNEIDFFLLNLRGI